MVMRIHFHFVSASKTVSGVLRLMLYARAVADPLPDLNYLGVVAFGEQGLWGHPCG